MKKWLHASTETHTSGCSFDFDIGGSYDARWLEDEIMSIFVDLGYDPKGVDFRGVDYPGNKTYSQGQVDFGWSGDYDSNAIENALIDLIDDEGGNFFGIDFYSLED